MKKKFKILSFKKSDKVGGIKFYKVMTSYGEYTMTEGELKKRLFEQKLSDELKKEFAEVITLIQVEAESTCRD